MASPLSQGLFQKAIGESGAYLGTGGLKMRTAEAVGQYDLKWATDLGKPGLTELRAMAAEDLLKLTTREGGVRFVPVVEGYFLPTDIDSIYAAGKQCHVPLMAGWNAQEAFVMGPKPTPDSFVAQAKKEFGMSADEFLKLYPAATPEQAWQSARDLSGDLFIAFSTWKWAEMQVATGKAPVYRYRFDQAPPPPAGTAPDSPAAQRGAYHSAEIEFVFGALPSKNLPWRAEDQNVSALMMSYWSNFAKKGDPNGPNLPKWPAFTRRGGEVMQFLNGAQAMPEPHRARYEFLDKSAER
jgi:para-nitrobenzyl esterase